MLKQLAEIARIDLRPRHAQPSLVRMALVTVDAVAVLMVMHLAIALATYNLLVHLAPIRPATRLAAEAELELPHAGGVQ